MILVLAILFTLLLSAFFSGSEIAFISANKLGIEIKREDGSPRGQILGKFFDKPEDFLGSMLVGNNIALVIFTYLMTELLSPLYAPYLGSEVALLLINTIIITLVVLVFGEFVPKTIFRLFANEALYFLAFPLKFFKILLKLPTWFMIKLTNLMMGIFIKSPNKKVTEALTRVDLQHFVEDTLSDFNEDIDTAIFTNALHLNQLKVRDCMVPRPEIIHFEKDESIETVIGLFRESNLSRILVTDGDVDNVIGYIHHQQLLDNPTKLSKLFLEILYVPEAMNVRNLMMKFINDGSTIACVVDEFGGTAGIITLEDILEEIFGEIEDEHDSEDHIDLRISEDEYLFSGRLEIDYIKDTYPEIEIPDGDYHTLSGFLVMTMGKIPESEGETIDIDRFRFIIEKLSDTKIETIRLIILNPEGSEAD